MKKQKRENAITLVVLIVTIVILLILAGITIATLSGENGLLEKVKKAKEAEIKTEMREELTLALHDLQIEKRAEATLDDVTQDWINGQIKKYECIIKEDASSSGKQVIMKKDKIRGKFLIDENLNIIEEEYNESSIEFSYETREREGNKINIAIIIKDEINGIKEVQMPDGTIYPYNKNTQVGIDYSVELGIEYKVKITSESGEVVEKTIKIDDYYYKVIKDIDEGILIDNNETKAAYNKPYEAIISVSNDDVITTLKVTMGEKEITTSEGYIVNIKTGKIKIEKVTDDIKIIAHISDNKLIFKFDGTSEDSYGHVTTESGKITYSDDAIEGKSAYFDGNSFIKIKVDEEDRLGDNFIIDWWEKPENNGTRFYSYYIGGTDTGLLVNYYGKLYASNYARLWNIFRAADAFCKNEFNVWAHWQLVRDGNTWTTYKNDKKYWQGNKTGTIGFDKNAYYTIGRYRDGDESYYKGYIDEFKIYINKDN